MLPPVDAPVSDDETAGQLLLFVCVANVCRSPFMEFLTSRGLHQRGVGTSWRLSSAGTEASDERRMCARSAAAIRDLPGGWDFATAHRSRPLTLGLVEASGLILVASQQERSVVARLSAPARARTFTMLEAALLAGTAVSRGHLLPSSGRGRRGEATLADVVSAMHLSRGLPQPRATSLADRLRLGRSRRPGEFDVADVHGGVGRRHAPVLADLGRASDRLTQAFARLNVRDD